MSETKRINPLEDYEDFSCPFCRFEYGGFEDSTGEEELPDVGALSFCATCGGMALFAETGLRVPTEDEFAEMGQDANVRNAALGWAEFCAQGMHGRNLRALVDSAFSAATKGDEPTGGEDQ